MILFTNSFQGHLQGYPLGLQLVVGLIDYQPGDPLSLLRRDLEDFAEKLSGQIDPYLMEQLPSTLTDYPRSFLVVWNITTERLAKHQCASGVFDLFCIMAFCDPEKTRREDVWHAYFVSLKNEL